MQNNFLFASETPILLKSSETFERIDTKGSVTPVRNKNPYNDIHIDDQKFKHSWKRLGMINHHENLKNIYIGLPAMNQNGTASTSHLARLIADEISWSVSRPCDSIILMTIWWIENTKYDSWCVWILNPKIRK